LVYTIPPNTNTMTEIAHENYKQYSIDYIQTILFECASPYILEAIVMKRLQELEGSLIIPLNEDAAVPTNTEFQYNGQRRPNSSRPTSSVSNGWIRNNGPTLDNKTNGRRNRPRSTQDSEVAMECWESVRNFKATEFAVCEGVAKEKRELGGILNKVSKGKFAEQKTNTLDKIREILGAEDPSIELVQHVFTLCSTNIFLCDIYAEIYASLAETYPAFTAIIAENIQKYRESIHNIHYVDPDKDYDGFCNYNKINDTRKSTVSFIVHLMNQTIIEKSVVFNILMEFMGFIEGFIQVEGRTNEVDEITENIFLVVSLVYKTVKNNSYWIEHILPKITEMSKRKTKEYKSLSSRAVFKYMDLMDMMKKTK